MSLSVEVWVNEANNKYMNKDYENIEQKAFEKDKKKKPKMIVSGKSVFLLAKQSGKDKKK